MLLGWLLRFLLLLIVVRLLVRFFAGVFQGLTGAPRRDHMPAGSPRRTDKSVPLSRDPVCGTYVVAARALAIQTDGTTHHFCSDTCRREFERSRAASKSA